jgi:hypothetical protein
MKQIKSFPKNLIKQLNNNREASFLNFKPDRFYYRRVSIGQRGLVIPIRNDHLP